MFRCAAIAAVLLALGSSAFAQFNQQTNQRPFPQGALRGQLRFVDDSHAFVDKDDQPRGLAPGSMIYKQDNSTTNFSGLKFANVCVDGNPCTVNYTTDFAGNLLKVWILTPEEASVSRPHAPKNGGH